MTKDELERIKQAYYSGLKVQIWFNGHWENFDARDYSMYSDPFSENRLYRIVGSAYADIAEKRISELEKESASLKQVILGNEEEIAELEEKVDGARQNYERLREMGFPTFKSAKEYSDKLNKAKEIIKKLVGGIRIISDPKVELTDVDSFVSEAEKFLSSSEKDK